MNSPQSPKANPWIKPLLLITVVLVLPVLLLAFWGESFAALAEQWQENPPSKSTIALAVAGILASDVFLPVPSGPITTLAGSQLGAVWGTLVSAGGMTLGGIIAFALAKAWGRPLAERLSTPEQLQELETACQEHGGWVLILTRPLPIVGEAGAMLVGALQMPWMQFLVVLVASNLIIAATYAMLGQQASAYGWLPIALCASAALPLLLAWWWRSRSKQAQK